MGRMQKISRAQAPAILKEIEREDDSIQYSHERHKIDYSKTSQNYDVYPVEGTALERLNERLSQVKCMNRADVNVLGQWVWTKPEHMPVEQAPALFKAITDAFIKEHGRENLIYARVHMDETNPHLHLGIVPIIIDNKGFERVNAKKRLDLKYLHTIHDKVAEHVEHELGYEPGIITGESIGSKEDFIKHKELAKAVAALEAEKIQLEQERARLDSDLTCRRRDLAQIDKEIEVKKSWLERIQPLINEIKERLKGFPNLLRMFCRYLFPDEDKISNDQIDDLIEGFNDKVEITTESINGIEVPSVDDYELEDHFRRLNYEREYDDGMSL